MATDRPILPPVSISLDPIRFPVPDPKGEKALGLARSWVARAEAALATGDEVQAAAYLAKCVKAAKTLL